MCQFLELEDCSLSLEPLGSCHCPVCLGIHNRDVQSTIEEKTSFQVNFPQFGRTYFSNSIRYSNQTLGQIVQTIAKSLLWIPHHDRFINVNMFTSSFNKTQYLLVDAADKVLKINGLFMDTTISEHFNCY